MFRTLKDNQKKIRDAGHAGVLVHMQCEKLAGATLRTAIQAANPNQAPDWSVIERVILEGEDGDVLLWTANGVVQMRHP